MDAMTRREAHDLATRIRREANVSVRTVLGRTNGTWIIHVINRDDRTSTNISSLGQWLVHPLNKSNKPMRARRPRNADNDLADDATVEQGLNTIYDPED